MVLIEVDSTLIKEIEKKFKSESIEIFELFKTLEENPNKGKKVGKIENILIKELKYKSYRFYFLVDGIKLIKFLSGDSLIDLLFKFVNMSKKNNQDKIIQEIKELLKNMGFEDIWY